MQWRNMKKQLQLLTVITTQLIHLRKNNKRELLIVATILLGVLLEMVTTVSKSCLVFKITALINHLNWHNEWTLYYTNTVVNFIKSFVMFLIANHVLSKVLSIRIIVLMMFILASMIMDFGNILSSDFYWVLKEFRYTFQFYSISVNFKSVYTYVEIAFVLYIPIDRAFNYFNNSTESNCFDACRNRIFNTLTHLKNNTAYFIQKKNAP